MMQNVEEVKWHTEWALITNKYGKLLSYNLPVYHKLYSLCSYQKYITDLLETNQYNIFLDVGAFVGLFSQIASYHCDYVCAYEAQPLFFGILLNNMKYYHNVDCKYAYVSCKNDIPMIDDNFMGLLTTDSKEKKYNIDVITLDEEWCPSNNILTLIKLDVEGNELKVLDGSTELIKKQNVHWIIDVHPNRGVNIEDVKKYFKNRKIEQIGAKVLKIE